MIFKSFTRRYGEDTNFHLFLNKIDQEFSEEIKQKGCPFCGGRFNQAYYPRSLLGMPQLFWDASIISRSL